MDKVKLPLKNGKIQDSDLLHSQLLSIKPHQINDKIDSEQFAELSELILLFQDEWMDNPVDFFQSIKDFLKVLDFEVLEQFPCDLDLWYYYYAPEQKFKPTVATCPLFNTPKLDAEGNVYNCLLNLERAQVYVQNAIDFAKSKNIQVPDDEQSTFKVLNGLEVQNEIIYSQIGTERVVFKTIQYLQKLLINNIDQPNVICLRRFASKLKIWIKNELSKEIYLTNCTHGKIADLVDRPETWEDFAAKHSD